MKGATQVGVYGATRRIMPTLTTSFNTSMRGNTLKIDWTGRGALP